MNPFTKTTALFTLLSVCALAAPAQSRPGSKTFTYVPPAPRATPVAPAPRPGDAPKTSGHTPPIIIPICWGTWNNPAPNADPKAHHCNIH